MVLCKWCKKHEGTHQITRMEADGSVVPSGMLCDSCSIAFKTPTKKLQRLLKRDGIETDFPMRPSCVVVKDGRVVTDEAEKLTEWLLQGYSVVGVADTHNGLMALQEHAKGVRG